MRTAQIAVGAIVVALIVTFGFGAAFALLVILAGAYVLAALAMPLFVLAKLRLVQRPEVRAMEHDDASIPDVARDPLRAHRDALVALGFEARDMIHLPAGLAPGGYLALYRHRESSASALSRVLIKPGKGPAAVMSEDAEFEMRYDNGTSAELSNVASGIPGLELIPGMLRQMPHERDVRRLFDYFLKLVGKYEREAGLTPGSRVPLPDDTTMAKVHYDQLEKSQAIQHRAGLLKPTGTPGVWRPTLRMALLVAAGMISPGLEFIRRRVRSRGDRLRRELDGDATRTTSERIGARLGWLMLAVGLPLAVVTVFMSLASSSIVYLAIILAWWIAKRRGREPGWRAIVAGGAAAMVLIGIPLTVPYTFPLGMPPLPSSEMLTLLEIYLLPMALLTAASALLVEGFRAAATGQG